MGEFYKPKCSIEKAQEKSERTRKAITVIASIAIALYPLIFLYYPWWVKLIAAIIILRASILAFLVETAAWVMASTIVVQRDIDVLGLIFWPLLLIALKVSIIPYLWHIIKTGVENIRIIAKK